MLTIEEREALGVIKAAARKVINDSPENPDNPSFRNQTAAAIMQGLVSNQQYLLTANEAAKKENGDSVQMVAQAAVEYTDALINELKKVK